MDSLVSATDHGRNRGYDSVCPKHGVRITEQIVAITVPQIIWNSVDAQRLKDEFNFVFRRVDNSRNARVLHSFSCFPAFREVDCLCVGFIRHTGWHVHRGTCACTVVSVIIASLCGYITSREAASQTTIIQCRNGPI